MIHKNRQDVSCQHALGAAIDDAMFTAQTGSRPNNIKFKYTIKLSNNE